MKSTCFVDVDGTLIIILKKTQILKKNIENKKKNLRINILYENSVIISVWVFKIAANTNCKYTQINDDIMIFETKISRKKEIKQYKLNLNTHMDFIPVMVSGHKSTLTNKQTNVRKNWRNFSMNKYIVHY